MTAQTTRTASRQPSTTRATTPSATYTETAEALERARAILDSMDTRRTAHCFQLAARAGMGAWSARFVSLELASTPWGDLPARVVVTVPSASDPERLRHTVTVETIGDHAACDCAAAQFGRACRHAGAAILYARVVVACYREALRRS